MLVKDSDSPKKGTKRNTKKSVGAPEASATPTEEQRAALQMLLEAAAQEPPDNRMLLFWRD